MSKELCSHKNIVVDYDHPHGLLANVPISDLQASSRERTRPFMTLLNPRCIDCGKALDKLDLEQRINQDGDLYDERFIFDFSE